MHTNPPMESQFTQYNLQEAPVHDYYICPTEQVNQLEEKRDKGGDIK